MRVVFMGTPNFAVPILEELISKHEVLMVVSQPDKIVGRKKILTPTPIHEVAIRYNIKCHQPANIKDDYQVILDLNPDIIITAAYGQMIPSALLDTPKYKAINVHASLLPKYRGGAPIHRAIINGDKEAGVSIMYMVKKMDAGDIIMSRSMEIGDLNTTELTKELSLLGRDLLMEALENIKNGTINPIKQDEDLVSFSYNITKEEEHLLFNKKAVEVYNYVRGLNLNPGCYFKHNDKMVKVYKVSYDNQILGDVSTVVCDTTKIGIQALDGVIYIEELQLEGKKMMDAKSFLNGMKTYFKKGDKIE